MIVVSNDFKLIEKAVLRNATIAKENQTVQMISRLFEIFGPKCQNTRIYPLFRALYESFYEIQRRLQLGLKNYVKEDCEKTQEIMKHRSESQAEGAFYTQLKWSSYSLLDFPQTALSYTDPELETITRIELIRHKTFYKLANCLKEEIEEKKEEREFASNDEMNLTQLYFRGGALVYNRETLFFSDMAQIWGNLNPKNKQKLTQFLNKLTIKHWAAESAVKKVDQGFMQYEGPSFQEFLISFSIDAVQKNLAVEFSAEIKQELNEKLVAEDNRSDLIYFTADRERFCAFDFTKLKRNSSPFLRALQSFILMQSRKVLSEEDASSLFLILIHDQQLTFPNVSSGTEINAFQQAWEGLKTILNIIHQNNRLPLTNSMYYQLLNFLLETKNRKFFIILLNNLSHLPKFSMRLEAILPFCLKNQNTLTEQSAQFFPQDYAKVIEALGNKEYASQDLFFDPPIRISEYALQLGNVEASIKQFVQVTTPYQIPIGKEYCLLLRQYILRPSTKTFDLLKDLSEMGIRIHVSMLLESSIEYPEEVRLKAKELTRNIQKIYNFSDAQIFSIYITFLCLAFTGKEAEIFRTSRLVYQLIDFCLYFKKEDICFLFRFHPRIDLEPLFKLRTHWLENTTQLNRFVIESKFLNEIWHCIDELATQLSESCSEPDLAAKFSVTCKWSLFSSFLPQTQQPLMDYFRITNLTTEGIRWGEPAWNTHLGQLKLMEQSPIGIYCNWTIFKGEPLFFISWSNLQKRSAFSACVPLKVSCEEIASEDARKLFYGFLLQLSQLVLKEPPSKDPPADSLDEPKTWISCFEGVPELIETYLPIITSGQLKESHVEQIWQFLGQVKLLYRNLFLYCASNVKLPELPLDPNAIAVLGHIFPSHPRGALLPRATLDLIDKKYYIPDASEAIVERCRDLFKKTTQGPEKLEDVKLNGSDQVFYHVQTAEQLTGREVQLKKRNERAPSADQESGRFITFIVDDLRIPLRYPAEAFEDRQIFQRYFDYHNLLLKSAYYRRASV